MKRINALYDTIEILYALDDYDLEVTYGYISNRFDSEKVNADGFRNSFLLQLVDNASQDEKIFVIEFCKEYLRRVSA